MTLIEIGRGNAPSAAVTFISDTTGDIFAAFDAVPGTAYLVRPDGYVMGRWREFRAAHLHAAGAELLRSSKGDA